ncbi:sigma-70 family RNA polymerase sigma factor [Flavobacteriaceae bacterium]|nr:sigma-70 family RNA polymerase sigma factor [Flavobacteriaceae bacterium]
MTDQEIIEEILIKGKYNSFGLLVDRYQHMAYTIAFKLVQDSDSAKDITQDAFLKAFEQLSTFKGQSKFSSWLYTIVYRQGLNELRKSKDKNLSMEVKHENLLTVENKDLPLEQLSKKERRKYITLAIGQLNEIDQSLISLFYLGEKNLKEIEEITGLSESNIKVRLHRSRKSLATILENMLNSEAKSII